MRPETVWLLILFYISENRLNGFENGKIQLFNSGGVVKWAYFQKNWSIPLILITQTMQIRRRWKWKSIKDMVDFPSNHSILQLLKYKIKTRYPFFFISLRYSTYHTTEIKWIGKNNWAIKANSIYIKLRYQTCPRKPLIKSKRCFQLHCHGNLPAEWRDKATEIKQSD